MPILGKTLLTLQEVQTATGLSEHSIRREMESGRLPSRLLRNRRRFLCSDVEAYLGAPLRMSNTR
jgi:predicted DNA-binding transcriptional regulator AlpA